MFKLTKQQIKLSREIADKHSFILSVNKSIGKAEHVNMKIKKISNEVK